MDKPQTYTAIVSSVIRMAGKFYVAKLRLTYLREIQFQAGQYVIFQIGPPKLRHTLSIASSPKNRGTIDILQSVAPMGEGSKWMVGLKVGDTVQFLGPLGKFILQKESPRPKVFVATGCGIAPLRSMIIDYLETGGTAARQTCQPRLTAAPIMLWWGMRYETDMFWQEELASLAARYPKFYYTVTLSQPASPTNRGEPTEAWRGSRGRVTEHVVGETTELPASEFYLCGSRQMIVDMRKQLTDNGVASEQIFTETFF